MEKKFNFLITKANIFFYIFGQLGAGLAEKNFLNCNNFTKAFLGTDGIGANGELSTTDEETSAMAELVIKRSDEVFILSDGSKIGRTSFVPYGNLADKKSRLLQIRLRMLKFYLNSEKET